MQPHIYPPYEMQSGQAHSWSSLQQVQSDPLLRAAENPQANL